MLVRLIFISLIIQLSNCAHYADLRGESNGSVAGAFAGGILAGTQTAGDLISIGAGTIAGSIIGGIIGASFDDMARYHIPDPIDWPIIIDCYDTYRPIYAYKLFYLASYCPGIVIPADRPDKYRYRHWHDYPLL